eukprot:scaffold31564_cov25-Tisochrysis_lutea.AAC.3
MLAVVTAEVNAVVDALYHMLAVVLTVVAALCRTLAVMLTLKTALCRTPAVVLAVVTAVVNALYHVLAVYRNCWRASAPGQTVIVKTAFCRMLAMVTTV